MHILLADANPEVRAALKLVLEQANLQFAGEAYDTVHLFALIAQHCPDVILLDAELPGLKIPKRSTWSALAELIETLHHLCPTIHVIAMSSWPNIEKECLLAKADAFVCKSDPPDGLLALLNGFGIQSL